MNHVNYVYRTSDEVDWSLAPDWANFYTIDSDSERWWFENMPHKDRLEISKRKPDSTSPLLSVGAIMTTPEQQIIYDLILKAWTKK